MLLLRLGEFRQRIEISKGGGIVEDDASTIELARPKARFALSASNKAPQAFLQRRFHQAEYWLWKQLFSVGRVGGCDVGAVFHESLSQACGQVQRKKRRVARHGHKVGGFAMLQPR